MEKIYEQRKELINDIIAQFDEHGLEEPVKQLIMEKMICFGPNSHGGTNILVAENIKSKSFIQRVRTNCIDEEETGLLIDEELIKLLEEYKTTTVELFTAVQNGFWLACGSGPLANEQMMGLIFILEDIKAVHEKKV